MSERFTVNHKISKIKKDHEGNITDVMLDNGTVLPINHAIMQAKDGLLDGVIAFRGKDGGEFLRTDPTTYPTDNLSDFPTFR